MTGTKQARIRTCHTCEFRWTRHSTFAKWPTCTGSPGADLALSNEFMEGPVSNCPRARWNDLVAVDLEAEAEVAKAKDIEAEIKQWGQLLDILSPDEKTAASISGKLEQLITAGIIRHPETAEALEAHVDER